MSDDLVFREVTAARWQDPDALSYRCLGFAPAFTAAGFRRVGRAGTRRYVTRLPLRRPFSETDDREGVVRKTK